jgi:hypothetical protein
MSIAEMKKGTCEICDRLQNDDVLYSIIFKSLMTV